MTKHVNQPARRRALKLAGVVLLSGAAGKLLLLQQARAGINVSDNNLADFVAISAALTGRGALDATLAQGLYRTFQTAVPDFDAVLLKLKSALARDGAVLQGEKTAFSEQQKAEHALSQSILQAWYLGVVGKGKKAVCVTYTEALSNKVVAGTLVPPSYSYGPCGSWSARP
jgi:hypothetical protein